MLTFLLAYTLTGLIIKIVFEYIMNKMLGFNFRKLSIPRHISGIYLWPLAVILLVLLSIIAFIKPDEIGVLRDNYNDSLESEEI